MKRKVYIVTVCLLAISVYTYSVVNTGKISKDIYQCIQRCINIIIPSLFIYMVLSSVIIQTGIHRFIFSPLKHLSKIIFNLPTNMLFVFLMGNICGYPIGASLIEEMYQGGEISKKNATTLLMTSYGGGPSFLMGIVGISLYNSEKVGTIVFLSCISANAVLAIFLNRFTVWEGNTSEHHLKKPDIISIISGCAHNMFKICAVIVSFSLVCTILSDLLTDFDKDTVSIIKSLFEITNISSVSSPSTKILPLIAAISSFGGICILLQLKAVTTISLKPLILSRLIACPLSAAFCFIYTKLLHLKLYTPASTGYTVSFEKDNLLGLILTFILILFLIFTTQKADD